MTLGSARRGRDTGCRSALRTWLPGLHWHGSWCSNRRQPTPCQWRGGAGTVSKKNKSMCRSLHTICSGTAAATARTYGSTRNLAATDAAQRAPHGALPKACACARACMRAHACATAGLLMTSTVALPSCWSGAAAAPGLAPAPAPDDSAWVSTRAWRLPPAATARLWPPPLLSAPQTRRPGPPPGPASAPPRTTPQRCTPSPPAPPPAPQLAGEARVLTAITGCMAALVERLRGANGAPLFGSAKEH